MSKQEENLKELARQKRADYMREYMREYRKRPGYKEKNRQYQQKYWERKALEELEG